MFKDSKDSGEGNHQVKSSFLFITGHFQILFIPGHFPDSVYTRSLPDFVYKRGGMILITPVSVGRRALPEPAAVGRHELPPTIVEIGNTSQPQTAPSVRRCASRKPSRKRRRNRSAGVFRPPKRSPLQGHWCD